MPVMPPTYRPRGQRTRTEARREFDQRRGSARDRGYDARWDKASASDRRRHPLCAYCELEGRTTPASLTDHLSPHRAYPGVFWLKHWWVSACAPCHNTMKQQAERTGKPALDALALSLGRPIL